MNDHYVNFDIKHLDWDSVYQVYYPKVQTMECDTELIPVFQEIIDSLKDQHVAICLNDRRCINYHKSFSDSIFVGFDGYKFKLIEPCEYKNGYLLYQSQLKDYACIELLHFSSTFGIQ